MNKRNGLKLIAVVVTGIWLPSMAIAEGQYSSQYSPSIGTVGSLLTPASNALNGAAIGSRYGSSAADSFNDLARKQREKETHDAIYGFQKLLNENQKEVQVRQETQNIQSEIDKNDTQALTLQGILAQTNSDRLAKQQSLLNSWQQFQGAQGINYQDVNTRNLDPICRNGVDFTQFQQLANQLGNDSGPLGVLRTQGAQILSDENEKWKKQKFQDLYKLVQQYEKSADEEPQDSEFQQNVADLAKSGGNFSADSLDKRLKDQQDILAQKKASLKQKRQYLVKEMFTKFLPALASMKKNDQQIAQLANGFANSMEAFRAASYQAAITNAQQLTANCQSNLKHLGNETPAPNTLTNDIYQMVSAVNVAQANNMMAGFSQFNQFTCNDATPNLDALFGSSLQGVISSIRGATRPDVLLNGAMAALNAIGQAQAQVGTALQPAMQDCQRVAVNVNAANNFLKQNRPQVQQMLGQAPAGFGPPQSRIPGSAPRGGSFGFGPRSGGPLTH
jgi:hypothetical protein